MPKRVGFLKEKILTLDNVRAAWEKFNRNRPVKIRRPYKEARAIRILESMKQGDVCFKPPRHKIINEGAKPRYLTIPCFDAAIAQTAILNYLNPIIDKKLHGRTYSSRKGWGMHKCAKKQEKFIHTKPRGSKYVCYFDIKKFYEHIRHVDIVACVSRVTKDPWIIERLKDILASGSKTNVGLPIGYPGSHIFANLMMSPLYYELRKIRNVTDCYVYMDNFIVYGRTKAALQRAMKFAIMWLSEKGMTVKKDWQIFPISARAVKTCGLVIRHKGMSKLYRRLHRRVEKNIERVLNNPSPKDCASLTSRMGWLKAANRENLLSRRVPIGLVKKRAKEWSQLYETSQSSSPSLKCQLKTVSCYRLSGGKNRPKSTGAGRQSVTTSWCLSGLC